MLNGTAIVISPLISLMKDQVGALRQMGVRAAFLNSALSAAQYQKALQNARSGAYRILYVAPERLFTSDFQALCRQIPISLIAVDEAHCVSQWGQDFRPSYLQIAQFIQTLPHRPPVAAFTATATQQVRQDIVRLLALRDPVCAQTGFDRPNLYFEVQTPKSKKEALLALMRRYNGQSGIVYCATRRGSRPSPRAALPKRRSCGSLSCRDGGFAAQGKSGGVCFGSAAGYGCNQCLRYGDR
jgi:ATP-dependent DNA helicase RecQ